MANADIPTTVGEDRHLPECQCDYSCVPYCGDCICDRLRACEQRVREDGSAWDEAYAHGFNAGRAHGEQVGRAAALRDAVKAVTAYEAERNQHTVMPHPSDDIVAALRVAARRIQDLSPTPAPDSANSGSE